MIADPDLWLVIGGVLGVLCIPALMAAWSEGEPPRATAIVVLIAGGMIAYAVMNKPNGYSIEGLPDVVTGVIGRYLG